MRKNALRYFLLLMLGLVAVGCNSSDSIDPQPYPNYIPGPDAGYTFPLVDLAAGKIPLPNNLLLNPTTGKLNLPGGTGGSEDNTINAANSLDGFSTTGPIIIPFKGKLDHSSVSASSLRLYDSSTGQQVPYLEPTFTEAPAGTVVTIAPLRPLKPSTNHIVVLTQGLTDLSDRPIISDNVIGFIQRSNSLVDAEGHSITLGLDDATAQKLEAVRLANQPVIGAAETLTGSDRSQIPYAFSFKTQTLFAALPAAHQIVAGLAPEITNPARPTLPILGPTNVPLIARVGGNLVNYVNYLITLRQGLGGDPASPEEAQQIAQVNALLAGINNNLPETSAIGSVYLLNIKVPQFRNDQITDYWQDPPSQVGERTVNVLCFLPNPSFIKADSTPVGTGPYQAVIFQHGITRSKTDAVALSNSVNSLGMALLAADLPLHGDLSLNPLDPETSGSGFINPGSPRVSRDNIRQGVVGLYTLADAIVNDKVQLANLVTHIPAGAISAGPPQSPPVAVDLPLPPFMGGFELKLASAKPMFIGQSLGAMVGDLFIATDAHAGRAVLNVPGGRILPLLLDSPTFGPVIKAGLAASAAHIEEGTEAYAKFVLFTQTVLDDVDPLNYAAHSVSGDLRGGSPSPFLQQLATNDQVILPSAQYDLAIAAGTGFSQVDALNPIPLIAQVNSPFSGDGLFEFVGGHGALLDPGAGPTAALHAQALTFLATGNIVNTGVHPQGLPAQYQPEDLVPYRRAIKF